MANGVHSQWDDIHVKLGNYEPHPEVIAQSTMLAENYEKMENFDPVENLKKEDVDSLEDEIEEELRKLYMCEQKEQEIKNKEKPYFGSLLEIGKQDYVNQVTLAPKDVWVVMHLYQPSNENCNLLNQLLERYAEQKPYIKFIKIIADKCVENFPDINCPSFIFYKNGVMTSFLQKVHYAIKITMAGITGMLEQQGVLSIADRDEEEDQEEITQLTKGKIQFASRRDRDVSDSDEDDREYENTKLKRFNFR